MDRKSAANFHSDIPIGFDGANDRPAPAQFVRPRRAYSAAEQIHCPARRIRNMQNLESGPCHPNQIRDHIFANDFESTVHPARAHEQRRDRFKRHSFANQSDSYGGRGGRTKGATYLLCEVFVPIIELLSEESFEWTGNGAWRIVSPFTYVIASE